MEEEEEEEEEEGEEGEGRSPHAHLWMNVWVKKRERRGQGTFCVQGDVGWGGGGERIRRGPRGTGVEGGEEGEGADAVPSTNAAPHTSVHGFAVPRTRDHRSPTLTSGSFCRAVDGV